ncbi:MAG TPA: hypothetical protein VM053_07355 [Gemmatimonadaceae bacterium]|nr:hypothetical protein [Gemmatimonadaceae bacterium]
MTRKAVGVVVIAMWVLGLAFLYKRNGSRSPQQDLAQAGMRVSPEVFYYTVHRGGVAVGSASSSVDTLKDRIVAIDFLRGAIPQGKDTIKFEVRAEARLTRGMRLRDFVVKAVGEMPPFTLRGVMQEGEDKTLRVTTLDGKRGRPVTNESVPDRPVFLATFAPLPLMLKGDPKIGDSISVAVFSPLSRTVEPVTLRIEADSLFLVPDSATMDSTTGRWIKAHQSSVRGWRIGSAPPLQKIWVDASGRLLSSEEPGGISIVRSTYELSFANWKLDHMTAADSARARAVAAMEAAKADSTRH